MIDFPIRKYMKKKWRARPRARARVFFQDVVEFAGGIRRQKFLPRALREEENVFKTCNFGDGVKAGETRIAKTIRSKSTPGPDKTFIDFRQTCAPQQRIFRLSFWIRAEGPQLWRAERARARARALSTREFLQNSHFLLYNFQNTQGKSCSAPRVWQLCKSWAQSEPISKSYDQNIFASFYSLKMHQKNHIIFELFLQFSRSPGPPVCKPSHMGKCMLKLLIKIDQNPYFQGKHEYLICHMGWLKDRGATDCKNNSIEIYSSTEQKFINFVTTPTTIKL